jgi:PAS domain S-box-containing protein
MELAAPASIRAERASALRPLALTCAIALVPLAAVDLLPAQLYVVIPTPGYLLFHNVVEFLGVMVALSSFGVGWFTHAQTRDKHALLLSCAFLAIGLLAFMHTLSYAGMPDFVTPSSPNKASQLWLVMRGFSAAAFLASAFVRQDARGSWLGRPVLGGAALAVAAAGFVAVVLRPGTLPAAFVPGVGQTAFKRWSEYAIVATFVAAILAHLRAQRPRSGEPAALYLSAFALSAFAEVCFAAYRSVTDTHNALGHLYALASYALVYRAVFIESVQRPHRELVESTRLLRAERDERAAAQVALARALEAQQRERDRVAAIMEASPVALVRVDPQGTVAYVNAEAERILGVHRQEITRRSYDAPEWSVCDPSGHALDPGELPFAVIARTHAPVRMRHGIRWPDGRLVVLDVLGAPLFDRDGAFEGAVLGLEDATERSRIEEQLRQSQKMEAVGRLAGGVAHDFNNVLTAILSAADLLLDALPPQSPLRADADEIRVAGRKAATLTRQLLTFSRKQVVAPRVLDLGELVTGLLPLLRRLIGEEVELTARAAPALGRVRADPGQVEQVIVNLVVNARDALPPGGGRVVVDVSDVEIDEEDARQRLGVRPGRFVLLSVSDDGCGMSPEVQAHLFEPFFTTKEPGKGTGLGLSTVYGIVRQCGGHVRVESAVGEGSTFRVFLPRADGEPVVEEDPGAAPPAAPVCRVLVVEDDPQVRDVVRRILTRAGHQVVEARDPADAVARAADLSQHLDVLVTDLVMPGIGGEGVAARVRALRPWLKVLFISGYTASEFDPGRLGPGEVFLAKPFTPAALLEAVQRLVQREVRGTAAGA